MQGKRQENKLRTTSLAMSGGDELFGEPIKQVTMSHLHSHRDDPLKLRSKFLLPKQSFSRQEKEKLQTEVSCLRVQKPP